MALTKTFAAALLAALSISSTQASVISGPVLSNHNTGWPDTGLQLTALKNTTLTSFVFENYGASDTITLRDLDGNVLQSYNFTGSGTEHDDVISVNWALTANSTYTLLSADPNNSKWDYYNFPVSSDDLRVDGGYGQNSLQSPYWFHFTNLTTESQGGSVPEPAPLALFAVGALGLMAARRRRAS